MITIKRISFVLVLVCIYFAIKKENIFKPINKRSNTITKGLQKKAIKLNHTNIENKTKHELVKINAELRGEKPVSFDEELEYRIVTDAMDQQEALIVDKCDNQEVENYSECMETQRNLIEATRIAMEERMDVMRIQIPEDVFFDNVSK
jgi:hypothetical protein